MFLSIVIPIYNDEKYLNECLDSCLNQDIPADDYEIICVDDGSFDRTPEILEGYAKKNSSIRLLFEEHGKGGRNPGLLVAKGDYVWFVDHDDLIAPNCLSDLKEFVIHNSEYERIIFSYYQFQDTLSETEKAEMLRGQLWANDGNRNRFAVVWNSLFKRSFLLEKEIFPRSKLTEEAGKFWKIAPFRVWGGDTVMNMEFFDKGGRYVIMNGRPLYHYRKHSSSETWRKSLQFNEQRKEQLYHRALLFLYLTIKNKDVYYSEKSAGGEIKPEIIDPVMEKLRGTLEMLAGLDYQHWKKGIALAKQYGVFFSKLPPEYTNHFSFSNYMRMQSKIDKLNPRIALKYFLCSKRTARLYRITLIPYRLTENDIFRKVKMRIKSVIYHK